MKKKLKLPILLLAVVVMLSIFYIKEATTPKDENAGSNNAVVSTLNPDFTEARLQSINETGSKIAELEEKIASGGLSADEIVETSNLIESLRQLKAKEVSLEKQIIKTYEYDDVLVLMGEDYLVVDLYKNEAKEVSKLEFISMAKMAKESFGANVVVKVQTTSESE